MEHLITIGWGIALVILAVVMIRRERRHFANAVVLTAGFVAIIHGAVSLIIVLTTHDVTYNGHVVETISYVPVTLFRLFYLFIFFLGVWLFFDGFKVIRREGFSLAHLLPMVFGLYCAGLPIVIEIMVVGLDLGVFIMVPIVALYVPFMALAYCLYSWIYACVVRVRILGRGGRIKKAPDYIVILGASLNGEKLSPLLARRADRALLAWERTGREAILVPSGGQGADEVISEAAAIGSYLREKGVPAEQILLEDQSVNTFQNVKFSKKLMDDRAAAGITPGHYALFATNNFHVLRGAIFSRAIGFNADGVGCKTAGYYLPAAVLREIVAFIFDYRKMALYYIALAFIYSLLYQFVPFIANAIW